MDNRKGLLLAIGVILMGLLITAGSYAFWSWQSSLNKNVVFNTSKALKNYIVYDEGESKFVGDFKVGSNYQDNSIHSTISLYKTNDAANVTLMATIHMDVNSIGENMKKSNALKWVVTEGNSTNPGQVLAQGNFVGTNSGDTLTLVPNIEVTTTRKYYTVWIWLDRNANPSDSLSGETLDTNVWTEINQLAGVEDRFEITRINANYQNINATVVDSKYKFTSYAVVKSGTTPSTWTTIDEPNNIYNLSTTVSVADTYDVYFKDENGRTTYKSVTVTSVDNTPPSCTFGNFTTTPIKNNETSDIVLTCIDSESEITVNNLTTSDITRSNSNITITNIKKSTTANGYKYTITVKGTENDGTTTLTLPAAKVKNAMALGNTAVTSNAITVKNITDLSDATVTLNPTSYTYDGTEKRPTVTVVKDGVTLRLDTDYTVTYTNNKNAGTATVTITGKNDYEGTTSKTFTINKREVTVTAENKTMEYGTSAPTYTYKVTNNVSGETAVSGTATYTIKNSGGTVVTVNATTPVGTYTITPSGLTAGSNYTIKYANGTLTIRDTIPPSVSDIDGGTTLKSATQTLTLKCTDTVGVTAYYFGTTEPTQASAITTTTAADLTSLQGIGLSKTVTTSGTYYLACRDEAGNYAKKSIKIIPYQVVTVLEKIAGTTDTYTSANYETVGSVASYYIKEGTTLPLTSTYTIPEASSGDMFKGYTTTGPGTSAANISTTNPTLPIINSLVYYTPVYYMWFNRNTYIVTVSKPTNGTVKAETVTKTSNSVTASTSEQTLTVKYGDTVKTTATPNTGYTFGSWSGGYVSGTTNPVTGEAVTSAKTITASFTPNNYTVRFRNPLPSGYQEVEYIKSSGTQYIDTGFIPNQDTSVELNFKALQAANQDYFGTSTSSDGYSYGFYDGGSNVYDNYNDDRNVHSGHVTGTMLVKKNKNVTRVSGDYTFNYTHSAGTFTSAHSLYLFARWKSSGAFRPATMELYEFKIWDGDTLVRDFVPCYRISDNEIGLYDIVNSKFYSNIGTGDFDKGNDVAKSNIYYDQTFTYNVAQTLDENTFTKNGYTFNGWNTKADGSGTSYSDKQSVNNLTSENNGIFELYAKWQRNSYTVQLVVNHGTGSNTKEVLYNDTETFTINNSTGYSNPTVTCTNGQTATISGNTLTTGAITNDTVCTVTYSPNTYTVRFNNLGYQPVEYIESTGTQYIDTGYYPNGKTGVYVDYQFTDLTVQQRLFSVDNNTNSADISYAVYINDNSKWAYAHQNGKGNWVNTGISVNKNRHTLSFNASDNAILIDNGNTYSSTIQGSLTKTSSYPMTIMARNSLGSIINKSKVKIYDFKIYEDGKELMHFIPVYRISDGEIGLFDIDNEVFYPNAGSGTFNKGSDLKVQAFTYGVSQSLDENTYERNGYVFNGWNTKLDGTGASYSDKQIVGNLTTEEDGVVDLYAKWTTNDYNIRYSSNNELCPLSSTTYANATVGYEDDINIPNPTCYGFTFSGWTSSTISSGAKTGTTSNPTTPWAGSATTNTYFKNLAGSPNGTVTLIATWTKSDNTKPTLLVGTSVSGTTYAKSMTATITISDDIMLRAGTYTIKYGWSTSALTCNDMTGTTTINVISGDTSKTAQVTIDSVTGAGKLYICNESIIYDRVGNELAANTVTSTNMYLDNTSPTGTMALETNGGVKTTLTVSDANSGMSETYYYKIDTSPITCNDTTTGFSEQNASTYTFMVPSTGTYYVCAKALDKAGNASYFTDSILVKAYLKTLSGDNDAFKEADYKTNITDIYFVDNMTIPNDAVATYDLDDTNVGIIKGWIVPNTEEEGKYKLYIGSNDTIYGRNLTSIFKGMSGVKNIDFDNFDTSEATSMHSMFYGCSGLTSLDLSGFNTSNVTSMTSMFYNCSSLTTLDLSNFNTSKVTSMNAYKYGMFQNCSSLTSLDLRNFNTSNVTYMAHMFYSCKNLTSLNLSSFDTSKVTYMGYMFQGCNSLNELDVSSFDTSKVTSMLNMFYGCSNLTSLDLSNFDTSKVTSTTNMIRSCGNLLVVYASSNKWNMTKVSTSGTMFDGTSSIVGGNGTLFSSSYTDKTRALIDTSDTVGYLTEKPTNNLLEHGSKKGSTTKFLSTDILKNQIKKITFTNSISGHAANGTDTWDVGVNKNGSVLAWVGSADENGRYEMTIGQNGGVVASNGYYLFSYLNNLVSFDGMEYFDTSNVINMRYMFDGDTSLTSIDLSHLDTSSVKTMTGLFRNCSSLTSIDMSVLDTSNTLHMASLFNGCSSLTSITFGGSFDTSKVTTMNSMFYGCSSLTSLDLSSLNTSNVTNMESMFQNCSKLTTLNLSSFNTSNVTTMASMFYGCSGLTSLNLNSWINTKVTNMSNMFYNCSSLTSINLSSFNTSNVTNMSNMFAKCSKLSTLDLSNFNTSNVTNMSSMFNGCSGLTSINLTNFNTSKVTNMNSMFYGCSGLSTLNLSSFDTSNVTTIESMFSQCSNLTYLDLSSFNTSKVTSMYEVFRHCNNLLSIYSSPDLWSTESITRGHDTFYINGGGCITNITGGNGYMKNNSTISYVYTRIDAEGTPGYFTAAPTVNVLEPGSVKGNTSKYLSTNILKNQIKKITFTNSISGHAANGTDTWDVSFQKNGSVLAWVGNADENGRYEMTIGQNGGVKVLNGFGLFSYLNNLIEIDGMEYFDVSDVTLMRSMFQGDTSLTTLDLSSWDTSKVKLMNNMFRDCSSLTSLDLSHFDTSKVTNMSNMFWGCSKLESINLTGWNTSNVTGMGHMFADCAKLSSLDLSSFNTSNVVYMDNLFNGCSSLTSLNLSSFDTSKVTTMSYMFNNCSKLTTLNLSNFNTPKVTNMSYMFYGTTALSNINISNFNTSQVTDMSWMFSNNKGLTSLDLSHFNTSNVTSIREMLAQTNLTTLNLSGWTNDKLTSMQRMFMSSGRLTSIDFTNFKTPMLTSISQTFDGCGSITSLDLTSWDTTNLTNMSWAFRGFGNNLDLSSFDTSKVTNMQEAFKSYKGDTIYVSDRWTTNAVTNSNNMFNGATHLPNFTSSVIDKTNAHYNTGGYLTYKAYTGS